MESSRFSTLSETELRIELNRQEPGFLVLTSPQAIQSSRDFPIINFSVNTHILVTSIN